MGLGIISYFLFLFSVSLVITKRDSILMTLISLELTSVVNCSMLIWLGGLQGNSSAFLIFMVFSVVEVVLGLGLIVKASGTMGTESASVILEVV